MEAGSGGFGFGTFADVCLLTRYSSPLHCFVRKGVNAKQQKSTFGVNCESHRSPAQITQRETKTTTACQTHTNVHAGANLKVQVSTSTTPTKRPITKGGQLPGYHCTTQTQHFPLKSLWLFCLCPSSYLFPGHSVDTRLHWRLFVNTEAPVNQTRQRPDNAIKASKDMEPLAGRIGILGMFP